MTFPVPHIPQRADLSSRWYDAGHFGAETLGQRLLKGAKTFPNTRMIFHSTEHPDECDLPAMVRRSVAFAGGLWKLGYRPGDVLAVQVPNWLEGAITYQAAILLGLVTVPIVHIYGPSEVSFIVGQSGARGLVVPERWRTIDYRDRVEAVRKVAELDHVIVIGDKPFDNSILWRSVEGADDLDGAASVSRDAAIGSISADDPSLLIYTSGTTAEPKGVLHSHNTLISEVASLHGVTSSGPGSTGLASFPAGHIAGVLNVLRLFLEGTSYVLLDHYDPAVAAEMVEKYGISSTAGAPFHLTTLMEAARSHHRDLSSLTGYMVGAASVPYSLVEEADRFGIKAFRAYGSSEHPVLTTGSPQHSLVKRASTDGAMTRGNEVLLFDDNDLDVTVGGEGEVLCRGPEQFLGYTNPAFNDDAFTTDGWFRTGDIGSIDADGYLRITDRKKDLIIRGGENIASKEVEDILAEMPQVLEAAVVGAPDARMGERVHAFVLARNGAPLSMSDVAAHFQAKGVARQKTPEGIDVVAELPRGMSGKVKKFELRQQLRDREPHR